MPGPAPYTVPEDILRMLASESGCVVSACSQCRRVYNIGFSARNIHGVISHGLCSRDCGRSMLAGEAPCLQS